jgi:hypothetical protein
MLADSDEKLDEEIAYLLEEDKVIGSALPSFDDIDFVLRVQLTSTLTMKHECLRLRTSGTHFMVL